LTALAANLSLKNLSGSLKELLFPAACAACGAPSQDDAIFCPDCQSQLEFIAEPVCRLCGRPEVEWRCQACQASPPAYDSARALGLHQGPLADTVRAFKYQRRFWLGKALARLLAQAPRAWWATADLVAPVPLHPRRLLSRGFNQALLLARPLAHGDGPALAPDLMRRTRHTRPQVGLDPEQRRANVAGAFVVSSAWAKRLQDKWILLVDDVFTTGATVHECAKVLKNAGAARVNVLSLVRAGRLDLTAP
jgi:ComF family protein